MVTHMKTTVDIADDLLLRAKREAEASHTTLRSLIEDGLREILGRKAAAKRRPVKPVTFRGKGLQREFRGKSWEAIHDARIAAICLNHRVAELWTADRDFSVFPGLKTRNPLIGR